MGQPHGSEAVCNFGSLYACLLGVGGVVSHRQSHSQSIFSSFFTDLDHKNFDRVLFMQTALFAGLVLYGRDME